MNKTPLTPELLRKCMRDGLGESHPVFVALENENKWSFLEGHINFVLHAYYIQEVPEYFFDADNWQKGSKVNDGQIPVCELNNGSLILRRYTSFLYGIGEKVEPLSHY